MASEISAPGTRRRYSADVKAEVLAQCDALGASASAARLRPGSSRTATTRLGTWVTSLSNFRDSGFGSRSDCSSEGRCGQNRSLARCPADVRSEAAHADLRLRRHSNAGRRASTFRNSPHGLRTISRFIFATSKAARLPVPGLFACAFATARRYSRRTLAMIGGMRCRQGRAVLRVRTEDLETRPARSAGIQREAEEAIRKEREQRLIFVKE